MPTKKKTVKPDKRDVKIDNLESMLSDADYTLRRQDEEIAELKLALSEARSKLKGIEGTESAVLSVMNEEARRMYHLLRVFAKDPIITEIAVKQSDYQKEEVVRLAGFDPRFM